MLPEPPPNLIQAQSKLEETLNELCDWWHWVGPITGSKHAFIPVVGGGWLAGVFFIRKGHWTKYEASIRATRKTSIDELDSQLRERIGDAD